MPADPQKLKHDYKWQVAQAKVNEIATLDTHPYFTKKCHFTLQLYTCGHKTWLNKPRIRHLSVFDHSTPSPPVVNQDGSAAMVKKEKTKHEGVYSHKARCMNMSVKPREVEMKEVCAKCRPVELGIGGNKKGLRESEMMVGADEVVGFGAKKTKEAKEVVEEAKGEKEVTEDSEDIGKDAEGNAKFKLGEAKDEEKALENEKELPASETESIPKDTKILKTKSFLGNLFGMFMPAAKPEEELSDDDDEPLEIWVAVDEDPDWEKINSKDGKHGLLWKDEGDWVSVNAH